MRYLIENLTEEEILAIDGSADVANCAITEYRFDATEGTTGGLKLVRYNFVTPLEIAGEPVTAKPDFSAGAR
jgi:hypothetical protein